MTKTMSTVNEVPTLSHVAKAAGVSAITVSRLLSGKAKVHPDTARRIRTAIARLGYKPNEAAQILKGQRSKTIGLVVPDLADSFYGTCAQAVYEMARKSSYLTVVVGSGGSAESELLGIEMMINRRIAGLLLIPSGVSREPFKLLRSARVPVVCIDRSLPGLDADSVIVNNRESANEAVKHLIGHGHRHILCIGNQSHLYPIHLRILGYEDAMREANLSPQVLDRADTYEEVEAALKPIMSSERRPTAVFCANNLATLNLLQAATVHGYAIPEQLAVVGFDDFKMAAMFKPSLTVVRQPVVEMSQRATSILLGHLEGDAHAAPATVMLSTSLVIRESCGCAQLAKA